MEALTDAERPVVEDTLRARNMDLCRNGLAHCNADLLDDEGKAAARDAYLARNFISCMNTVGTLVPCRPEDLSHGQREQVRQRNLAANRYVCRLGIMGCDESLLTAEERESLATARGSR